MLPSTVWAFNNVAMGFHRDFANLTEVCPTETLGVYITKGVRSSRANKEQTGGPLFMCKCVYVRDFPFAWL